MFGLALDLATAVNVGIGVLAGGLVTGFFSWLAYRHAKNVADGTARGLVMLTRRIDPEVELNLDELGFPKAFVVSAMRTIPTYHRAETPTVEGGDEE